MYRQTEQEKKKENLELLAQRYRQHQEIINHASGTIKNRMYDLDNFFNYLLEMNITDVQQVTVQVIINYQKHLFYSESKRPGQDKNSIRYHNKRLVTVKDFFKFLYQEDYLASDPAKDVQYAKEPQQLPKVILTQEEAKKIINAPDIKTLLGYRDRTMLEIFYSTGIRRNELRYLKIADVDYEQGYIRVCGKGNKDRVVPLGRIASKYVENYIKGIRPEFSFSQASDHLFVSLRGKMLGKNLPAYLIDKYTKKAGLKKHITPHTWRHSCATHLVRNRANLRHVQEMLGHKSLDTTQKYVQLTITDLKEAHKKYHPRERIKKE